MIKFDKDSDKIYQFYVFDEKEECVQKHWSNLQKYYKIKDNAIINFLGIIKFLGVPHAVYKITEKEGITLTNEEKALIAGFGNLSCGYIEKEYKGEPVFAIALTTQGF